MTNMNRRKAAGHAFARYLLVGCNLEEAERGERAFEFRAAYNALTSLDHRNPQAQTVVRGIYNAPDPAKALLDWWEYCA